MDGFLSVLCLLGIVLVAVTLVGHALWLLCAAIIRGLKPPEGKPCDVCGAPRSVVADLCRVCGSPHRAGPDQPLRRDLYATARQLFRLHQAGELTAEQFEQMRLVVERELQRVGVTLPGRPPATQPSLAPILPPLQPTAPIAASPFAPGEQPVDALVVGESPFAVPSLVGPHAGPRPAEGGVAAARPVQVPPPVPPTPRRSLADVLQSFMEATNIRWVELLTGIVVVVCAIGLVISLHATLKDVIPYFPALMFMLMTGGIHFAGVYSLRKWNLKTTSQGVLLVATLLIPLNFVAAIVLSGSGADQRSVTDPTFLSAVAVGLLAFGTMNYFAARALVPFGWWRVCVAVLGASVAQIPIHRLATSATDAWQVSALAIVPLASFLVATVSGVVFGTRRRQLSPRFTREFFTVLGVAAFALLCALALFVMQAPVKRELLANLSPALSLAAAAVLVSGLMVHRRTRSPKRAALRTAGTAIAVFGAGLMLLMVVLAWPRPELLIAVGLVNFCVLSGLAVVADLAVLHIGATACLALAYLVGFHLAQHHFVGFEATLGRRMFQVFVMGRSAVALTLLAGAVAALGAALLRGRRRTVADDASDEPGRAALWLDAGSVGHEAGLSFLASAGGLGVLSIAISLFAGFLRGPESDSDLATPVLLLYAIGCIAACGRLRLPWLAWVGSALLWLGLVHGFWLNDWLHPHLAALPDRPVLLATLLHAILVAALGGGVAWWRRSEESMNGFSRPLCIAGMVSSVAAAPFVVLVRDMQFGSHTFYAAGIATVWLVATVVWRSRALWTAFQSAMVVVVSFAATTVCQRRDWWSDAWFDLRHVESQIAALALACMAASVLRKLLPKRLPFARLLRAPWPPVDRSLVAVLIVAMVVVAGYGCVAGVGHELGMGEISEADLAVGLRHALAFSLFAWVALACVFVATLAALCERRATIVLAGFVAATAAVPLLVAGPFEAQQATASALRWSAAMFGLVWCVVVNLRTFIAVPLGDRPWVDRESFAEPARVMRAVSLLPAVLCVVGLTTWAVIQSAAQVSFGGPAAESFFGRAGAAVSYATPLGILFVTLFAYALRDGKAAYASAAGAVLQYLISLAFLLPVLSADRPLDGPTAVQLLQWNVVGLAGFVMLWLATRRWLEPGVKSQVANGTNATTGTNAAGKLRLLDVHAVALWTVAGLLPVFASCGIIITPALNTATDVQFGLWPSYLAFALALAATLWFRRREWRVTLPHVVASFALSLAAIGGATSERWDTTSTWLAYHVIEIGWLVVAAGLSAGVIWLSRRNQSVDVLSAKAACGTWGTCTSVLVIVCALRAALHDPLAPWWSFAALAGTAGVAIALGLTQRRQRFAYASVLLAMTAVTVVWFDRVPRTNIERWINIVDLNLVVALLVSGVWLSAEIWYQYKHGSTFAPDSRGPRVHAVVLRLALVVASMIYFGALPLWVVNWFSGKPDRAYLGGWLLMLMIGMHQAAALWDRRARHSVPGWYVWGLLVAAAVLWRIPLVPPGQVVFAVLMTIAGYVAITGRIWAWGANWARLGERLGVADPNDGLVRTIRWLPSVTYVMSAAAVLLAFCVVLAVEARTLRISAGFAPVLLAVGVASLAQQNRRAALLFAGLLLVALSAVFLGWADMEPTWVGADWLDRLIRMLMMLAAVAFVYGVVLVRVLPATTDWWRTARRAAVTVGGLAIVTLLAVLAFEFALFEPGVGAPVDTVQLAAVSVVLVGLVAALVSLAVLPGRDPLELSEAGRMWYVYGAQLVGALLFAHIYLVEPQLFSGRLRQWWPFIVMAIAFAGVGVGELFQRLQLRVLAEPFQRTGSFLPLLPVLGFWVVASESNYSSVLFVVGVLYMLVSICRKSVLSGFVAALAGNGALWSLLADFDGFEITSHPQLWLIPPAVSVLVAAHINRRRLSEAQLTAVRYACMIVVYLSSTGEMFIIGVGESLWPPLILAALSIVGVVVGIAMQIRAFLYVGSGFVLLSVMSMVTHAAKSIHATWPWWAFLFAMGIAVFVLLGVFEKKRPEMQQLIARLREWER